MYYVLFLTPIALQPLKISNRLKGIISSLALGLTAIFRFGSGADYFSYSYLYYLTSGTSIMKVINSLKDQEIGFRLLMFPFRVLNLPYEVFIAFIAIVIMTLMYFWIQKNAKTVTMAYLVYYSFFFLVWNISSLRQGLAITIGCYLLFNSKFQWHFRSKIIIILCLATLHITSLFFLVFVFAELLKWDKKKLIYLVLASLVVSLLPVNNIAVLVAKIPIFSRVAYYLDTGKVLIGFWDFKSIARLILIGVVLFHYDSLLEVKAIPQRFLNAYVIGISFFFFLRFDDLIGARISIYGFFLAVLILPAVLDLYDKRKWISVAASTGFIVMCALYLQKELNSMATQAGIETNGLYIPYISIFQQKDARFTNRYYYVNNYVNFLDRTACQLELKAFGDHLVRKASTIKDPSKYLIAKYPNGFYGLVDTEGHIVLDGNYKSAEYYGGIIRVSSTEYFNYQGVALETQKAAMNFFNSKARTMKYIAANLTWFEIGSNNLDTQLSSDLEKQGQFKFLNVISQINPLNFYIMEYLSYQHGMIYQLYRTDMTLLSPEYFLSTKTILANRVLLARNVCSTKFFNEDGELIWMQEN
jgi:hypothetical protein